MKYNNQPFHSSVPPRRHCNQCDTASACKIAFDAISLLDGFKRFVRIFCTCIVMFFLQTAIVNSTMNNKQNPPDVRTQV